MMRFLLDCLRPGRQRAGCGRENSVDIPTKEKEPGDENELKDLEDVVAMEEGALQRDRTQCRDSQQALESLAKRRAQLKEEIQRIQEQRKQEGQLLLSLQQEQEELEQKVQEYDGELKRAREELQRLQEEISNIRSHVEEVHGRMGSFKHCIGDTYTDITEAKQRLGELITEMIAIEACAPEVTTHQVSETFRSSGEEDEDAEGHCQKVYEEDKALAHNSVETEASEHADGPEKLQRSVENLKSSGSSSFTEITLTEFKDEDASPRSITSQHTGSADLEEEDYEIVQSLMSRPVNQSASKEFDFFQPDPFIDYDVFGDERFPKVDMTEFLYGDPFKGSDPFACDNVFSEGANGPFFQDSPVSEDDDAKESSVLPLSLDTVSTEQHSDISNVAHIPISSNCSQSIDSGMFEQNMPEIVDSEKHTTCVDICPQVGIEITVTQEDHLDLYDSIRNKLDPAASPEIEDGRRFDPIVCEYNDIQESDSSSTVDSSFDGDFGTAEDHPDEEPEVETGPSYVRRNHVLYGLQRIDTSSYTSFPLSPDAYDPEPFPGSSNVDESQSSLNSNHDPLAEVKPEIEIPEETQIVEPANPNSPNQETHDVSSNLSDLVSDLKDDHFSNTTDQNHEEPADTDVHKFGDIYFFTVRLDPGSSDASPVSPEASERKKSEVDHTSPESVDTDEFDYVAPEYEDPMQHSLEEYPEESFDKEESEIRPEHPPVSPESKEPVGLSEVSILPSVAIHQEQNPGIDAFECNMSDLKSNSPLEQQFKNVDLAYTLEKSLQSCFSEPVDQYLISPASGDTKMFATDGYKLCARNPFSFDTGSIDHYDNTEYIPDPHASTTCVVKESGSSECLVLLDPVLVDNAVHAKNPNTDTGRLDSGYHEFSVQDPFSPDPTDLIPVSTEMDLDSVTDNPDIESNSTNLDIQVPDPFSPESNDTAVFVSEPDVCNVVTNNEFIKDSGPSCIGSSDVFADTFTESELDSFDPFGPMPHFTASSYTYSNSEILITGSLVDESISYGDNRSSSGDSEVSQSPQLHCDSVPDIADVPTEANRISPDDKMCSPSYTTDFFLQSDSNTLTNSFTPNHGKIILPDKNTTVDVAAMEDLAEIDFFCSELSKMVASRSSDSVQQSVTEMLFGSNPDTAKFYPWDLENSHADINETSSPENDIEKPSLL